jgi:cbb3-type cytochrome oxidase maturation protein
VSLPVAVTTIICIIVVAGALALAAFVWAVRTKQFSIKQLNEGAKIIFDDEEPVGTPQDLIFKKSTNGSPNHH